VQRDLAPRRAKGQGSAADAEGCAGTVSSKWAKGTGGPAGDECYNLTTQPTAGTLGNRGLRSHTELDGHGAYIPVPFTKAKRAQSVTDDETWVDGQVNPTLSLFDQGDTRATTVAVGFNWQNGGGYGKANDGLGITVEGTGPLQRCNTPAVAQAMTVRRLTPRECERLQGFPDDYTAIPWRKKPAEDCPDGPRYKALGNSMAVNCMAWIGERIAAYEARTLPLARKAGDDDGAP
jgi:DNA (cytosine-5)-methyltransferase 1